MMNFLFSHHPLLNCFLVRKHSYPSQLKNRLVQIAELLELNDLNEVERASILEIINEFPYQFHLPIEKLGSTKVLHHAIVTTDEIPINTKQYRFPPVWVVPKKSSPSGKPRWHMVIDYRKLNEKTISDAYPLPNITDILDQLGAAKYFSILDLASGFHQIPMDPKSKAKTAFSTPHGHYEFNKMPFGLKNAPATFQRCMDLILSGLQGIELFVYIDDIVIYADSLEEHSRKLRTLLARLQNAGLALQPEKCRFLRHEIGYLGHVISSEGVKPDPFVWNEVTQSAFEKLRDTICSEPLLQFPNFNQPFLVTTDASDYAVGAILSQGQVGKDLPIAYASRTPGK